MAALKVRQLKNKRLHFNLDAAREQIALKFHKMVLCGSVEDEELSKLNLLFYFWNFVHLPGMEMATTTDFKFGMHIAHIKYCPLAQKLCHVATFKIANLCD